MTLTKAELADILFERVGLNKREAKDMVEAFFEEIRNALERGDGPEQAGDVADNPVSPKDVLATMYHLLGVNPFQTLPDKTGRQIPLLPEETRVVAEALA